ncbi:Similar to Borcs6: BLOC-1-related complex subunit 6 (Rattus norvegicus) [Cotesia congregata]|uniref:Similar to Borcs6: BLOC-1-related complex subunit 6 (Rattus norvegicus) n=1 Tax=Cotesia congregata TaxID=51543 RepID=A0A8J2HLJ2_COTCN|nr:Similar to Borcs6: BLOC-1-related complex subunit 6 (Rattus norvegicus) [Cotesia congregata]
MESIAGKIEEANGQSQKNQKLNSSGVTADYDHDRPQEMTASYSEISFDSQQSSPPVSELRSLVLGDDDDDIDDDNDIPGLPDHLDDDFKANCNSAIPHDRPAKLKLKEPTKPFTQSDYRKAMGYLRLEAGTVMQDGDMVLFVAEDLENKIKLSSPITSSTSSKKSGELSFSGSSRSSTPCLYRQALNPQLPLPADHNVLNELELEARKIATSVDSLTENLAAILHSASAVTVDCLESYRDAVCKTCDGVDHNIKSMYQLMAKSEELSKSMGSIYKLADQIKTIKRLLDLFEGAINF